MLFGRVLLAFLLLMAGPAFAGSSTYTPPGVGFTFQETTNAAGFFNPNVTIWDYSAAANGLAINADHSLNAALVPETTGGLSVCTLNPTASTNSTNCKASAGQIFNVRVIGNAAATVVNYLRLYNLSSAPTCSSATGLVDTIPVPFNAGGAGIVESVPHGVAYGTGIGFCFTGGYGTTDTTNATASAYTVTIFYK